MQNIDLGGAKNVDLMFIIKAPVFVVVFAIVVANIYDLFVEEPPLDEQCRFVTYVLLLLFDNAPNFMLF
jgi:hypothetical protein